ncbi:DNA polymerase III subunit delta' [Methylomonas methanica]|uniref:DNA polymerase III subunit delta' n=1 Tax=Methylomonas methanica (strain DSM 25384 / MC09) TaxID=857087 RepID=G0A7L0_METMM|nr:DNA polymerase III subunit delta' [Methylomonas methanica]AEG01853.1 DNA polymerase III, delta prime subunit [Methylomonas methanica MC09]
MMSSAAVYPWQQAVWQHLLSYKELQRIPQALLITGVSGIGKRHLADAYARALMCHTPLSDYADCGKCQSCKLFAAQTHPDFLQVEPDEPGKAIGIDKIRQLIVKLALKPQFETQRVVIISPADSLNNASANAFLKCLEEPTARTCLILLTEKPSRLPATIRSRCQVVTCEVPERGMAEQWLQQQGVGENRNILLSLSQGAPLLARAYAQQNFIAVRQDCFNAWVQVAEGKMNLVALAEQWQKTAVVDLHVLLTWMLGWVADLIKSCCQIEADRLCNPDMKKPLQALAKRLELMRLYPFYDSLLIARSQLSTPINKQLLLEQLLISWSQLNKR